MIVLKDKVVIVTGASAGIGEAVARALAAQGAVVVLAARRRSRLDELQREIEDRGGSALAVTADITDARAREGIVREAMTAYGRIDALINNAGFGQRGPIETVPLQDIRRNFETNLFSLIGLTQLVLPVMRSQGAGRIVNIGSVAGKIARPFTSIYDATKHALEAVTDGLRGELLPFGIQVVLIEPGFILTDFIEVAREIATPILEDQASPYARYLSGRPGGSQRAMRLAGKPEDVVRVVVKALTVDRPKARYAVPGHAHFFLALRWLLPDRVFDRFVFKQMGLTK